MSPAAVVAVVFCATVFPPMLWYVAVELRRRRRRQRQRLASLAYLARNADAPSMRGRQFRVDDDGGIVEVTR